MASTERQEEEPDHQSMKQPQQKQGSGKLYSKMLSKEAAATLAVPVPSFRVYYGVASAGSVPFLWESQPGTPKSSPSAAALPPLTPPPSYYSSSGKGFKKGAATSGSGRRWPGGGGVMALLRRPRRRTSPCSSSLSWSSASSASSMSPVFTVQSSPAAPRGSHRRVLSAGDIFVVDDAVAPARCFGMERERERGMVVKGCGVSVAVRNALATIVGHRSGGRATSAAA